MPSIKIVLIVFIFAIASSSCKKKAPQLETKKNGFHRIGNFSFNEFTKIANNNIILSGLNGYRIIDSSNRVITVYENNSIHDSYGNFSGNNYYHNSLIINGNRQGILLRNINSSFNYSLTYDKLGIPLNAADYYISLLPQYLYSKNVKICNAYDGHASIINLSEQQILNIYDTTGVIGSIANFDIPKQNNLIFYTGLETDRGYFFYDRFLKSKKGYLFNFNGQITDSIDKIKSVIHKNDNVYVSTQTNELYVVSTFPNLHKFELLKKDIEIYDFDFVPTSPVTILLSNKHGLTLVDYQFNFIKSISTEFTSEINENYWNNMKVYVLNNKIYTHTHLPDMLDKNEFKDLFVADLKILSE